MRAIGTAISGLVLLAVGLIALLFFLSAVWPGDKIYFRCTEDQPGQPSFGLFYDRLPAWVLWGGEDTGRVTFEKGILLVWFDEVRESDRQLSFDGGPDGQGNGTISKLTGRVAIKLKSDLFFEGECRVVPGDW